MTTRTETTLDVERLARALHEMEGPGRHSRPRLTRMICPGPGHHMADAEKVAAEYALPYDPDPTGPDTHTEGDPA